MLPKKRSECTVQTGPLFCARDGAFAARGIDLGLDDDFMVVGGSLAGAIWHRESTPTGCLNPVAG
jgi:hypothetical protein